MRCTACGTENEPGRKFCGECGAGLAVVCPSCGIPNAGGVKFCGECGASLVGADAPARPPAPAPVAERRLVSVLFADLVGFTSLSEHRDAEETRALLSRYFDTCRRLIELYGGTVEKFIGDAVMAVWGTPAATEDDAERAVRAALDLVAAVTALGDELGAPGLRARAGVLTGEAAVTLGAEGEGMVAGDLVNTASRIQAAAEPGAALVGDATRRATEQTVVYEDAGSFELKGKDGLTPLWRALRVVSGARGALKSQGLEPPFVGRDRELRQIKELFHACADGQRPHLVSITGIAGIGKSRLGWEFYKYFDGIAQITYWHRGRCLSYGEGVTYWALADMVRMRARIAEDEEAGSALAKLREVIDEHVADPDERRLVEPRLAHLIGIEEGGRFEREDLFAAWRLFFERLAQVYPVVMLFEDMQWADASLLDFIEYMLEWARSSPILVVTQQRPDLLERRPTWGAGHRNFTSMFLEPLPAEAMQQLLGGLVPGLPDELRAQILARAEGDPAVRGRDGADAARPRRARAGRAGLPAGRPDRVARGAGDAARADRGPARRAAPGRAPHRPGRGRARQDVHEAGARGADGAARGRRSTRSSRRSRARRSSASRPTLARRSTASTASSRTCCARSPTTRWPRANGRRSHLAAAAFLEQSLAEQESRRGRRLALPRRLRGGAGRRRRGRDQDESRRGAGTRRRAGGVARRERGGGALFRPGGRSSPRTRSRRRSSRSGPEELGLARRPRRAKARAVPRPRARGLRGRGPGAAGRRGSRRSWPRSTSATAICGDAVARLEAALETLAGEEPTRTWPRSPRRSSAASWCSTTGSTRPRRGSSSRWSWPRRLRLPEVFAQALTTKSIALHRAATGSRRRGSCSRARSSGRSPNDLHAASMRAPEQPGRQPRVARPLPGRGRALRPRARARPQDRRPGLGGDLPLRPAQRARAARGVGRGARARRAERRRPARRRRRASPPPRRRRLRPAGTSPPHGAASTVRRRWRPATTRRCGSASRSADAPAARRGQGRARRSPRRRVRDRGRSGARGHLPGDEALLRRGARGRLCAGRLDEGRASCSTTIEALRPGERPPLLDAHAHRFRAKLDGDEGGLPGRRGALPRARVTVRLAVTLLERTPRRPATPAALAEAREIFARLGAAPWLERAAGARRRAEVPA